MSSSTLDALVNIAASFDSVAGMRLHETLPTRGRECY